MYMYVCTYMCVLVVRPSLELRLYVCEYVWLSISMTEMCMSSGFIFLASTTYPHRYSSCVLKLCLM